MTERWIVIPKWEEFQHYKDRDPKWIKAWCRLLSDDDYMSLSFHLRGVLHSLWMAYASANGQLLDTPQSLHRQLGHRVMRRDVESLNHAGFIGFSGTKPAQIRTPETETEKELKRARAQDRKAKAEKSLTSSEEIVFRTLIANGAIQDRVDLDAEIRGRSITGPLADKLRDLIPPTKEAAA